MRGYHDSKTMAVLYPSTVLLIIAEKINLSKEAALNKWLQVGKLDTHMQTSQLCGTITHYPLCGTG